MADVVREYFRALPPEIFVEHAKLFAEIAEERRIALDGLCGVLAPPLSYIDSRSANPSVEPLPPGSVEIIASISALEVVMIQLGAFREGVGDLEFLRQAIRDAYLLPNSAHTGTEIEVERSEAEQT